MEAFLVGLMVGILICIGVASPIILRMLQWIRFYQGIINTHNLCHDQHESANAEDFASACAIEQRHLYGRAPHADSIIHLQQKIEYLEHQLKNKDTQKSRTMRDGIEKYKDLPKPPSE